MKLFWIEGKFNNPIPVGGIVLDVLMHEHNELLKKMIDEGSVLFTGSKRDLSGVVLLMKAESFEMAEKSLKEDPLYKKDVQKYSINEFKCSEASKCFNEWLNK